MNKRKATEAEGMENWDLQPIKKCTQLLNYEGSLGKLIFKGKKHVLFIFVPLLKQNNALYFLTLIYILIEG